MWQLWGGADVRARETDIPIPITNLDKSVSLARGWYAKGFRLFKIKVGKDVENDIRRLEAVHRELPGISFIGDGNQGFSRQDCLTFAEGVKTFGGTMVCLNNRWCGMTSTAWRRSVERPAFPLRRMNQSACWRTRKRSSPEARLTTSTSRL